MASDFLILACVLIVVVGFALVFYRTPIDFRD